MSPNEKKGVVKVASVRPGAPPIELPTLTLRPKRAHAMLSLAHGAGAGMHHPFMQSLSEALGERGVATMRFAFPFTAHTHADGGARPGRPDRPPTLIASIRAALADARKSKLPLFAGGKSMGGRMTTLADAEDALDVRGIVLFGFPLHAPKTPSSTRGQHLRDVHAPMLFLQGARDALTDLRRLRPLLRSIEHATLHVIEHADHGFSVPKRTGRDGAAVIAELAEVTTRWIRERV